MIGLLTGVEIAVMGGDARQLEVIKKLAELDSKISLIGFEQLNHPFAGASKEKINEMDFSSIDAVILPIPGTDLEGKIETIFSNEEVVLKSELL